MRVFLTSMSADELKRVIYIYILKRLLRNLCKHISDWLKSKVSTHENGTRPKKKESKEKR